MLWSHRAESLSAEALITALSIFAQLGTSAIELALIHICKKKEEDGNKASQDSAELLHYDKCCCVRKLFSTKHYNKDKDVIITNYHRQQMPYFQLCYNTVGILVNCTVMKNIQQQF